MLWVALFLLQTIDIREVLACGEIGAFAMCTSPLDVATVTISRLVGCGVRIKVLEFESDFSTMM